MDYIDKIYVVYKKLEVINEMVKTVFVIIYLVIIIQTKHAVVIIVVDN